MKKLLALLLVLLQLNVLAQSSDDGVYNQKLNPTHALIKENGGLLNIKWGDTIGGVFKQYISPIFYNNTVFQSFEFHYIERVNNHGVAVVLDPKSKYFKPYDFKGQKYNIDSVTIRALYIVTKPEFKDTIILELIYGDPSDTTEANPFNKLSSNFNKYMAPKHTGSTNHDTVTGLTANNKLIFKKVIDKSILDANPTKEGHLSFPIYTGGIEIPENNIVCAYFYYKTGDTTYPLGATYHTHSVSGQSQTMNSFSPHVYQQYNINPDNPTPLFYDASSYNLSYSNLTKNRYMEYTGTSELFNYILYPDLYTGYDIEFKVTGNFVQPLVNDMIAGMDQVICYGDTVELKSKYAEKYLWSNGDTTQTIHVSPTATTSYFLTAYQGLESATDMVKITVYVPIADAGVDQTICTGGSATLSSKTHNYYKYKWSNDSLISTIVVAPTQTKTYRLTVSYGHCNAIDEVVVHLGNSISAKAYENQTICKGGKATLFATGGDEFKWSYLGSITNSITVKPNVTTTYYVTVKSGECSATDRAVVTIGTSITAYAGEDITVNKGDSVLLTAKGGDKFEWSTSDTTKELRFIATSTRKFTVTVYSGTCSATDDLNVTVINTVGIEEIVSIFDDNNIKVYPNPANENINVSFKNALKNDFFISIYDYTGKEVYRDIVKNKNLTQQIDISNLNNGLYFINIRNKETVKTIKFIKN